MYLGQIVEAPVADHPYTKALLAEVAKIAAGKRRFDALKGKLSSPVNPPRGWHFRQCCPFADDCCRGEVPMRTAVAPSHSYTCHLNRRLTA